MRYRFKAGDYVIWKWTNGYGHGKIISIDSERTGITSHGKTIWRDGSPTDPAVTILDHNHQYILKLSSELESAD
jgi:hypothetical protein